VISGVSVLVQTNPVNRITNLPKFLCVCLTGVCRYPYQKISTSLPPCDTAGPKFSPVTSVDFCFWA